MKALIAQAAGQPAILADVEDPPVRDHYVKIKVHAVALNPTDWKHLDFLVKGGEIMGCDVAGTVEEVGSKVTTQVKRGDRIAGMVHGGNESSHRDGGFAEHAEIKDGIFLPLPESWSWAEGATLGVGITTVGQALYESLKLPLPDKPAPNPYPILIYGGSTATGTLAIQFAKLSGLEVMTTASPQHFDMLTKLGASFCFDYNKKYVGSEIRRETGDDLCFVFDTITNEQSMEICAEGLATSTSAKKPLHYTALLPPKGFPRQDANARRTLAYTAIGEAYDKGGAHSDAKPADWEFAKHFWALAGRLVAEGKLKPHPAEERSGGLEGVLGGLADLKAGKVRGVKLVYGL